MRGGLLRQQVVTLERTYVRGSEPSASRSLAGAFRRECVTQILQARYLDTFPQTVQINI